jgi:hypothetical protein
MRRGVFGIASFMKSRGLRTKFLLPLFVAVATPPHSPLSARTIPASWSDFDPAGGAASGTLGPLRVTASQALSASPLAADLTGTDFSAAPLGVSQGLVEYEEQSDFRIALNRPVDGLMLYLVGWRSRTYTFSRPFTILSGLGGVSVSGNSLTTPVGFTSGIIRFDDPVSSFVVNNPAGSASRQDLTLAVIKERTLVSLDRDRSLSSGASITLRGSASATFSVKRVLVRAGHKAPRAARLSNGGRNWRFRLRPEQGLTRVRYQAVGFDGSKSVAGHVRVGKVLGRISLL